MVSITPRMKPFSNDRTFEGDVRSAHGIDLLLRLGKARIAPPTEMEAKAPIWRSGGKADHLAVLFDDALWVWAREEVQVEGAADEAVLNQRLIRGRR